MNLTALAGGQRLTLPDDLLWTDEHAWTRATASVSYLLTGALLVESALRQSGRPITLASGLDMAWVPRSTVATLHAWASEPGRSFELLLWDARRFVVGFRHHESAIEAEPVLGFVDRTQPDRTWYRLTLRLMEL